MARRPDVGGSSDGAEQSAPRLDSTFRRPPTGPPLAALWAQVPFHGGGQRRRAIQVPSARCSRQWLTSEPGGFFLVYQDLPGASRALCFSALGNPLPHRREGVDCCFRWPAIGRAGGGRRGRTASGGRGMRLMVVARLDLFLGKGTLVEGAPGCLPARWDYPRAVNERW